MTSSFFFLKAEQKQANNAFIRQLEQYANDQKIQVYVSDKPLGDNKYSYDFEHGLIVMIPKHKVMIINFDVVAYDFEEYAEDIIEDLGSISDKFNYKNVLGRARSWREEVLYISERSFLNRPIDLPTLLRENQLTSQLLQKKSELLISLITGSINDIYRVKDTIPENILDKIKQKIQLFDGEQTRFIYQENGKATITIQGLSGTGKTELLLHKLKDIYLNEEGSRTLFTCHNKILASSLRKRIPDFFNFMKVEQQIKWNERLWCIHAWGSQYDNDSGAYRHICHKYNIPFHTYSFSMSFGKACQLALNHLSETGIGGEFAFDYALIDESQDFPKEFIELCRVVTKNTVYVAGDIFQSIFDENIVSEVTPDYLLSKCYRTDPRTLMFAHALGMGLFEDKKLRWLEDNEWEACGYMVDKVNDDYLLKREPLRRFEDLGAGELSSMNIIRTSSRDEQRFVEKVVLDVIQGIIDDNQTATADDIGIVFLGSNKFGFRMADLLEHLIPQRFGWEVNKAYETKRSEHNTVFISNKNNVKGLEFPFVICVADYISNAANERNALYMLLTRSFIKSYLLVQEGVDDNKLKSIEDGLAYINENGNMLISAPSKAEKDAITTNIVYDSEKISTFDLAQSIFEEVDVPPLWRDALFSLIKQIDQEKINYVFVKDFVETNLEKMAIPRV
jgi:superfamily I DNA and RNA helicase